MDGTQHHMQVGMPKVLRKDFLHKIHNHKVMGHLGMDKTKHRLIQRVYWFKWQEQVEAYCNQCDLCTSRKPPRTRPRDPMQQHLTGAPMERVSLDILGPLPRVRVTINMYC